MIGEQYEPETILQVRDFKVLSTCEQELRFCTYRAQTRDARFTVSHGMI